jgi:xylan 1,4-beta-xylosidase
MKNPILPGSHPDPDLIKVGDDFYLATTTFEWLPGVRIHHSRDLVNWRLVAAPLDGKGVGDLRGVPDSGGNYIPSLSWHDGLFYLVYSVVLDRTWPWMANRSYVTTAASIEGPWSDPVHLNSMGFDPALFWDEDGRGWFLHLWLDYRKEKEQMRGIHIQEFDPETLSLVGENRELFRSPPGWFTEGPHLFPRNGFYYLSTAIFGTYAKHATMVARSENLLGPYEVDPGCPMLTCVDEPSHPLQKAGQGYFVDVGEDDWVLAHHASRPVEGHCSLGRETCLQSIEWTADGWPRLAGGGVLPSLAPELPDFPAHPWPKEPEGFGTDTLSLEWNTLREPAEEDWISLKRKPGFLCLRGRLPITSKFGQSLLARRWTSMQFTASVQMEFDPVNEAQLAGLICYYDTSDFVWAALTRDEEKGRVLVLMERRPSVPFGDAFRIAVPVPEGALELWVEVDVPGMQFRYRQPGGEWQMLGERLSSDHLSDEGEDGAKNGFTGAFVGVAAQDLMGESKWAVFSEWGILKR